jgi:hypothetical protein
MRHVTIATLCALIVWSAAAGALAQEQGGDKAAADAKTIIIKDKAELDAYREIEAAPDLAAKLTTAQAFLTKYPQSVARDSVDVVLHNAILDAPDGPARLDAIKTYKTLFPNSTRQGDLNRILADAFVAQGNFAEAKKLGAEMLAGNPSDPWAKLLYLRIANDALAKNDTAHVAEGLSHGKELIDILEADKRPASMDDARWQTFKKQALPMAHQKLGVLMLVTGDMQNSGTHLTRATALSPADPINYFFLANLKLAEYDRIAEEYNKVRSSDESKAKQLLSDANTKTDEAIAMLVKTVAMAGDRAEYGPVVTQARPELERLYKQRHGGKLDGLDAAINAAKTQP